MPKPTDEAETRKLLMNMHKVRNNPQKKLKPIAITLTE